MHVRSPAFVAADSAQDSQKHVIPDTLEHDLPLPAANMTAAGYVALLEQFAGSDTFSHGLHPVINHHLILGRDSVTVVVDSMARAWVSALTRTGTPAPRERLNIAALQVYLKRDAEAEANIAAWLATPGVTRADTALAWRTAVQFFLTTYYGARQSPARMDLSRRYLARLETMPLAVGGGDLVAARLTMMDAFINLGQADSAVSIGLRAYATVPHLPTFEQRAAISSGGDVLFRLCQAIVGRPNGLARVDSLLNALRQNLVVPPALAAQDTALVRFSQMMQGPFAETETRVRMIGHPSPAIVATHWFNQTPPTTTSSAAPNARELTLNDGTIRIIGFGWFGCPACAATMAKLQDDQRLLPKGVKLMYYEWTLGNWGSDLVEPEEEVGHIKHYWIERKHYTFPITIWAGPKDSTPGGGLLPRESPTRAALHITAGPTFLVIDGHGIIRFRQEGYNNYQIDFAALIERLLRETDGSQPAMASAQTH